MRNKTLKSFLALPQQRSPLQKVHGRQLSRKRSVISSPLILFDWTPGKAAPVIILLPKCNECKTFTVYSCGYNS